MNRRSLGWGLVLQLWVAAPSIALAAPTVELLKPLENETVADELFVRVRVTSLYAITSVTASVEGVSAPLGYNDVTMEHTGTLLLGPIARGSRTLNVVATDSRGDSGSAQRSIVIDHPPRLTVMMPVQGEVARPNLRVMARCED